MGEETTPPPQLSLKQLKSQVLFEFSWKIADFQRLSSNTATSKKFGPYKDWLLSFDYDGMIVSLHNDMGHCLTTKVHFQLYIEIEKTFQKLGSGSHYFTPTLKSCGIDLTGLVDMHMHDLILKIVIVRQVPVLPLHSHYDRFKTLFQNSQNGDIELNCQDGEVVVAQFWYLIHTLKPFFKTTSLRSSRPEAVKVMVAASAAGALHHLLKNK